MLEPIEKQINGKTFVLTKFPAMAGQEIVIKYSASGFPNVDDYASFEEVCTKLMAYVGVPVDGKPPLMLTTKGLIENHISDWRMLIEVQKEMMEYNKGFL